MERDLRLRLRVRPLDHHGGLGVERRLAGGHPTRRGARSHGDGGLANRHRLRPSRRAAAGIAAGVFAAASTIFYLLGVQADATPAVVTASMFPAVTVIVGRLAYRDSVSGMQLVGIVVALAGIVASSPSGTRVELRPAGAGAGRPSSSAGEHRSLERGRRPSASAAG